MKLDPESVLLKAAETLKQRNAKYKRNYIAYGKVMEALFPNGIELDSSRDHVRFHMFVLLIVKITRYAKAYEEGGCEDSLLDAINYLAFLHEIDNPTKKTTPSSGSISELWVSSSNPNVKVETLSEEGVISKFDIKG